MLQDGTLTDSDALHFEAYRQVLLELAPQYNG
jgi:beta-phosphoglucomutase-like phosphatase (HAD superfamily)